MILGRFHEEEKKKSVDLAIDPNDHLTSIFMPRTCKFDSSIP